MIGNDIKTQDPANLWDLILKLPEIIEAFNISEDDKLNYSVYINEKDKTLAILKYTIDSHGITMYTQLEVDRDSHYREHHLSKEEQKQIDEIIYKVADAASMDWDGDIIPLIALLTIIPPLIPNIPNV